MVIWSSEHAERWCPGRCTLNLLLLLSLAMRTVLSLSWGPCGKEGSSPLSPGLSWALAQATLPLQQSSAWLLLKLEKQLLDMEQKSHAGLWHEGTSPAGSTPRGCKSRRKGDNPKAELGLMRSPGWCTKDSVSVWTEGEEGGEVSSGDGVDRKGGLKLEPTLSLNMRIMRGMGG